MEIWEILVENKVVCTNVSIPPITQVYSINGTLFV